MSYELRREETLGKNLQRICRKQIEGAIAIARGREDCEESPVHATRKHLKKARAALHLMEKAIGRDFFRRQDRSLRDAGRLISDLRDAEVRLQTVRQLQEIARRRDGARYGELEGMLQFELENFTAAFAEWQTQALPMLEQARDAVDCWPLDKFDGKQLRCAVQRSYKAARQALARAAAEPTPQKLHNFRSKAKLLWHQLRIVRPMNPMVLKNLSDELASLGDLLGRAHDLNFLEKRLGVEHGRAPWQREGRTLLPIIERSENELERAAVDLAERFFAERANDFGKRVEGWTKEWAEAGSESLVEQLV